MDEHASRFAYSGNIRTHYIYRTVSGFGTIGPILTLFMLGKPLALGQFMVLMGILNVTIMAFEIPTGIVADRVSRKLSVAIGVVLGTAAVAIMLIAARFWILAIGFFVWGVGETFFSGADTALLYDSLKADGREEEAHRIMGTAGLLASASGVAGALACSLLVRLGGLAAPFAVGTAAHALLILPVLMFREPPLAGRSADRSPPSSLYVLVTEYWRHFADSLRVITGSREVLLLVLVAVLVDRLLFLYQRPYAQPALVSVGFEASQLGILYAAFGLLTGALSRLSSRIAALLGNRESRTFVLILLLAGAAVALYAFARDRVAVVAGISLFRIVGGIHSPAIQASLNRRLPSEKRAACLSVSSAGNHFLGLFLGPLYGYIADATTLRTSLLVFLASFGPLLLAAAVASAIVLRAPTPPETGEPGP